MTPRRRARPRVLRLRLGAAARQSRGFVAAVPRIDSFARLAGDAVHDDADDGLLFGGAGFGDHDGQRDEGVVVDELPAVGGEKRVIPMEEMEEQRGGDALVAVGETVVLRDEVKQVRGLFLQSGIDVGAAEALVDVADASLAIPSIERQSGRFGVISKSTTASFN